MFMNSCCRSTDVQTIAIYIVYCPGGNPADSHLTLKEQAKNRKVKQIRAQIPK